VFIDRNGDLFSQVLDFMRYGSIELSSATPKSMFDRELDFYSITADEGSVQHQSLAKVTEEFIRGKSKHDMFRLALESHYQFGLRSNLTDGVWVGINKDHVLYSKVAISNEERQMFRVYLDVYFGLVVNWNTFDRNKFYVCRKE
jgi:hypothetical protein